MVEIEACSSGSNPGGTTKLRKMKMKITKNKMKGIALLGIPYFSLSLLPISCVGFVEGMAIYLGGTIILVLLTACACRGIDFLMEED
jgi:hypothetical protein